MCRNKSSRIGTELFGEFLYNKRKILEPRTTGGAPLGEHDPPGRPPPQARPGGLRPPGGPVDPDFNAINTYFSRKNQGGRNFSFHETEPPPPHVLHRVARFGVRLGLRRGGSSIFVITNPPPSPIPLCSPLGVINSFVGSLVGEELDEIHHVIELVLLGLDP